MISTKMMNILGLAMIPLLLFSIVPIASSAQQSQPHTMLGYVEGIYSHSGTFTVTKSTSTGNYTETIAVDHHGNPVRVQRSLEYLTEYSSHEEHCG